MHKNIGTFWLVLAVLYLWLAIQSFQCGRTYDRQIAKVPSMQVTSDGALRITPRSGATTFEVGGSGGQGDAVVAVVADLWADLRAYLNASTSVNMIGFVLAAAAAIASFVSSRPQARGADGEPAGHVALGRR